jgi:hypothetical protein
VISYAVAVAERENSRWAKNNIESIQHEVFTDDYENIPLYDRARWETTGKEKYNQEVLRRLIENNVIRDVITVEQNLPEEMAWDLGVNAYNLVIVSDKKYSYTNRMGRTEELTPAQVLEREGLDPRNTSEEEAINTLVNAYKEGRLEVEGSDERDRMTYFYQQLSIEKVLRDVVTNSDFTVYVDLVGDSLKFKEDQIKLDYIRNWFNFPFKDLMNNPEERPIQLYSYPELQQAVYYGNLIREIVSEDYFVNMWSSLLPNVGLGGLPLGIYAQTHGTPVDVLLTAAFELPYRWHLMEKTKKLMMIPEQQKRELAADNWWQVPRVDREYERSRAGPVYNVFEDGAEFVLTFPGREGERDFLFTRWLIGNWDYTTNRNLIHMGSGFMGLGERFPDWRPEDMTFELKEAGAIWYVWEAMQYSAKMWNQALSIVSDYAMSQTSISRNSRKQMIELYENFIPDDPLEALEEVLSCMPSSRRQSMYLFPPTPEYGTTSEEGMDRVSNEIISRFYGDIDREIIQMIPKVPNIASLISELIFTGDYSPTYKYGKRAESKTQTHSKSEQKELVMGGDVPGVTIYGIRPRPTFCYSPWIGFTAQPGGIGLDYLCVEQSEGALNWGFSLNCTQFQLIQEAVDRIETQERAERLSEILHPEPEASPLFNLQNSLNQQNYGQGLELFNGVYLQPSSTGNFGFDINMDVQLGRNQGGRLSGIVGGTELSQQPNISVEVESVNDHPLNERVLEEMLCGIFAEYSNQ